MGAEIFVAFPVAHVGKKRVRNKSCGIRMDKQVKKEKCKR
jgi:hypothetical protein